jgi:hypothetical protein
MAYAPHTDVIAEFLAESRAMSKDHAEASRVFGTILKQFGRGDENAKHIIGWMKVAFEAGRAFQHRHPKLALGDEGIHRWVEERHSQALESLVDDKDR